MPPFPLGSRPGLEVLPWGPGPPALAGGRAGVRLPGERGDSRLEPEQQQGKARQTEANKQRPFDGVFAGLEYSPMRYLPPKAFSKTSRCVAPKDGASGTGGCYTPLFPDMLSPQSEQGWAPPALGHRGPRGEWGGAWEARWAHVTWEGMDRSPDRTPARPSV